VISTLKAQGYELPFLLVPGTAVSGSLGPSVLSDTPHSKIRTAEVVPAHSGDRS
jgi:hypothetical protein